MPQPVLRYPGSKWGISTWIVEHFPPHAAYVEPFFGSGAVLLRKSPARSELVNDLDGNVVTFFRVLRDRPEELAAAVALTPYARDELAAARVDEADDDLERARRFAVECWQTRGGAVGRRTPGWRFDIHGGGNKSLARVWADLPGKVMLAADRLRGVMVENAPAMDVIARARRSGRLDAVDTLIYADPPYLGRELPDGRPSARLRLYRHELSATEHLTLLDALDAHPGPVVLSGYASDLYDDRLRAWARRERITRNQNNDNRTEVLWLNPVAARQVSLPLELEEVVLAG